MRGVFTDRPGSYPRVADGPLILVIEDETAISEFLRVGLSYEGYRVTVAGDGRTGLRLARTDAPALVILDLMLPDLDGFEVRQRLRTYNADVPIIMLTAKTDIPARVTGLDLGADDYVTKPFSFEELLARIRAVLRRRGIGHDVTMLEAAGLRLDLERREALREGLPLDLTPIELALLELFLRHPDRTFSRQTLRYRVWGTEYETDTNVVDVHIGHLRAKLGNERRTLIRTVYGVGYRFDPNAHEPLA